MFCSHLCVFPVIFSDHLHCFALLCADLRCCALFCAISGGGGNCPMFFDFGLVLRCFALFCTVLRMNYHIERKNIEKTYRENICTAQRKHIERTNLEKKMGRGTHELRHFENKSTGGGGGECRCICFSGQQRQAVCFVPIYAHFRPFSAISRHLDPRDISARDHCIRSTGATNPM